MILKKVQTASLQRLTRIKTTISKNSFKWLEIKSIYFFSPDLNTIPEDSRTFVNETLNLLIASRVSNHSFSEYKIADLIYI
jgi:hypothetical protein